MIKLKEILNSPIPPILFHATFKALVSKIKQRGLLAKGGLRNFEDAPRGVYLSNDFEFSGSMVEASENDNIPSEWFDEIVVLSINTSKLNPKKFDIDPNVDLSHDPIVKSYIYRGNIPSDAIYEINDYH